MSMVVRLRTAILESGEGCLSGKVYVDPNKAARAVLRELREPTPGMLCAGEDASDSCHDWSAGSDRVPYDFWDNMEVASNSWKAMIDAALEEE